MTADTLPPLPEPAREAEEACASWRNASPDYFTAAQMRAYAIAAVLAERERCARIALDADVPTYRHGGSDYDDAVTMQANIAAAIRATSQENEQG
jgi:hypothetical protein